MDNIIFSIKSFLENYNLDNPELIYLAAFSGGYDSMCLLHILKQISKNKIVAIHLNHNWRGEESDREENNCKQFCQQIGVEFYSEKLPQNIEKTETAARNARYEFFKRCSVKFGSKIIFTAHNKNDNVETLLFRICHGTGISGLQGISPKRDIYYRPLLNTERNDIENYCKAHNLTPNFDSSNNDNIHKRNLIRNKILPLLEEISPKPLDSISSLSIIAKEETELIKEYTFSVIERISKNNKINTQEFLQLSKPLQNRIIYGIITPLLPENYDRERILTVLDFIIKNSNSKSGKTVSITTDKWIFVNEKYFELISKTQKDNSIINIKQEGVYEFDGTYINISKCNTKPYGFSKHNSGIIFADFSGLDFDFQIRHRKDGDIICPIGLNGTQKLKKYLNEKKIPNHEKDSLVLLTRGKEILYCAGIGISDKIKVRTKPTHKIEIRNKNEY